MKYNDGKDAEFIYTFHVVESMWEAEILEKIIRAFDFFLKQAHKKTCEWSLGQVKQTRLLFATSAKSTR